MLKENLKRNKLNRLFIIFILLFNSVFCIGQKITFQLSEISKHEDVKFIEVQGIKFFPNLENNIIVELKNKSESTNFIVVSEKGFFMGKINLRPTYCNDNSLQVKFSRYKKRSYTYYQENCSNKGIVGSIRLTKCKFYNQNR